MSVNGTRGFEKKKNTQIKPNETLRLVTIHWGLKTRNDRSAQETEQYLYRFLPLIHLSLKWTIDTIYNLN